jgi:3-methyladenine DNA glycosylase/8-oxoguanine DNA glycosylase
VSAPTNTALEVPRLASLPAEREQLEFSSRSIVFVEDGRRLLRAWGPAHRPWVLGIEPRGQRWRIEAWGADPPAARSAARALFSLDHRLEEFYRLVRNEPVLRGTERRFRGLRLPRDAHLYEALLHAIIGQQLSVHAANALTRRLFERTDAFLEADGIEVPCVPSPRRLRALRPEGLRAVGMSWAKARAVSALARHGRGPASAERDLAVTPLEEAVDRLTLEPGVGRWTAENALLRATGRTDVFVAGDLGVRVALDEYGVVARDAPEATARSWGAHHYPGWGSYATLYLWRRLVADRSQAAGG